MGIGIRIRALRERNGFTQEQLAKQLGITAAAVGNYEQDISFPRGEVMYRLFRALNCEPNELFIDYYTEKDEVGEHLRKYRELDDHGKELVNACTDIEHRRCTELESSVMIAARGGTVGKKMVLKKRNGCMTLMEQPDYNGGSR